MSKAAKEGHGPAEEGKLSALAVRAKKVDAIFAKFDTNSDGRLSKEELAALVVAVNPSVQNSEQKVTVILDEVFSTYSEFIDHGGLSLAGFRRTYDDGVGDVDRDFEALCVTSEPVLDDESIVFDPMSTTAEPTVDDNDSMMCCSASVEAFVAGAWWI
ncbi:hypothetical protein CYMTET_46890 [Cymbomonas tetramitiformis]|uniref:EF-hand domain-containing protein n=1 Tax=Cymbomonas tetramitiformis TaxID=36881 RepID=A0AAE0EX47_9CHLO|nr:hypothetical protein CYMTET_46890 [Cymbomonas tetramitiformis]|eukprot:gene23148-28013_t